MTPDPFHSLFIISFPDSHYLLNIVLLKTKDEIKCFSLVIMGTGGKIFIGEPAVREKDLNVNRSLGDPYSVEKGRDLSVSLQ